MILAPSPWSRTYTVRYTTQAGYLLLAGPSPCLRLLVLRELFGRPEDDSELQELLAMRDEDPLVSGMLALQNANGSWDAGTLQATAPRGVLGTTCQALTRLGYLGFGSDHIGVQRASGYVFDQQQEDGSWPLPRSGEGVAEREGYSIAPLQTAIPLASLAICGLGTDPRAERAYEWLLEQRLDDGAWPTGIASGVHGYVAGYRRLPHSRWGCRSNTTGALTCLACKPAPCVAVCPTGAFSQREGGGVRVKKKLCIRCGDCARACPVDAVYLDGSSQPFVCIHCGRCVSFCPHDCLAMGASSGNAPMA